MPGLTLLVVRLVLSSVLVAAGAAKLRAYARFRETLAQFGVPKGLTSLVALVLPLAELAAAALLLLNATTLVGAVAAGTLFGIFTTAVGYQLARGRAPKCTCFGRTDARPIDRLTFLRNLLLSTSAILLILADPAEANATADIIVAALMASPFAWTLNAVLLAAVTVEAVVLAQVMRRHGRALVRIDELELRLANAPEDASAAPYLGLAIGEAAPLLELPPGIPAVVIFLHPKCTACAELRLDIARWQRVNAASLHVVVVSERADASAVVGIGNVVFQEGNEIAEAYRVPGTPAAVLINRDRSIGSPLAVGGPSVRRLVARATHPRPGFLVPNVLVTTSENQSRRLRQLITRDTVLLFWSPQCPFCRKLVPDLIEWERRRPADAPDLVLVSNAQPTSDLRQLASPVFVDTDSVALEFRATVSPSALMIDMEGVIRSELAMGSDQVLALLREREPVIGAA